MPSMVCGIDIGTESHDHPEMLSIHTDFEKTKLMFLILILTMCADDHLQQKCLFFAIQFQKLSLEISRSLIYSKLKSIWCT